MSSFGSEIKYKCKLLKNDGDIITKNTQLIEISEIMDSDGMDYETLMKSVIKAETAGRVFYLVKEGQKLQSDSAVVIIADPSDTKADVMKWYKNMK